jgi:hypothetical protein
MPQKFQCASTVDWIHSYGCNVLWQCIRVVHWLLIVGYWPIDFWSPQFSIVDSSESRVNSRPKINTSVGINFLYGRGKLIIGIQAIQHLLTSCLWGTIHWLLTLAFWLLALDRNSSTHPHPSTHSSPLPKPIKNKQHKHQTTQNHKNKQTTIIQTTTCKHINTQQSPTTHIQQYKNAKQKQKQNNKQNTTTKEWIKVGEWGWVCGLVWRTMNLSKPHSVVSIPCRKCV